MLRNDSLDLPSHRKVPLDRIVVRFSIARLGHRPGYPEARRTSTLKGSHPEARRPSAG